MYARDLGQALKLIMKERGWSQTRLARELGTDQQWVSRVVNNVTDPGTQAVRKYLDKVGWEIRITPKTEDDEPVKRREFIAGATSVVFVAPPKTTPFSDPGYVAALTQRMTQNHYHQGYNGSQVRTLVDHARKIRAASVSGGRRLQSAASDFMRYGSYALRGAGRADIATKFANNAIHLANQAEDSEKQAKAYCALGWASVFDSYDGSVVSTSSNKVGQAVMLARRGLKIPGIGDEPRAWLNSLLACGLANAPGNERNARAAVDRALSIDTIPAIDRADVIGTAGNAVRDIGARGDALNMLEEASRLNASCSPYLQARYLTDRIMLALDMREPSMAASNMNTLACLVPLVDSARLDRQVNRALETAKPWATVLEVRDARERLQSVL